MDANELLENAIDWDELKDSLTSRPRLKSEVQQHLMSQLKSIQDEVETIGPTQCLSELFRNENPNQIESLILDEVYAHFLRQVTEEIEHQIKDL